MSNSVKFVIKIFILIVYLIALILILESHYVAKGECVARIYYYPLGRCDYLLIPLAGIVMLSISLFSISTSKKFRAIEVFIYAVVISVTLLYGNVLLASKTINWPEEYHPSPVQKNMQIHLSEVYSDCINKKMSGFNT